MIIKEIEFGSDLYEAMKDLRSKILREPLGMVLNDFDLKDEGQQIHIAALDDNKDVVGTIVLKPLINGRIKLRQMAVDNACQGSGLGREMTEYAENLAATRGFEYIELAARVSALGFYERLGYTTSGGQFTEIGVPHNKMEKRLEHDQNQSR